MKKQGHYTTAMFYALVGLPHSTFVAIICFESSSNPNSPCSLRTCRSSPQHLQDPFFRNAPSIGTPVSTVAVVPCIPVEQQ